MITIHGVSDIKVITAWKHCVCVVGRYSFTVKNRTRISGRASQQDIARAEF